MITTRRSKRLPRLKWSSAAIGFYQHTPNWWVATQAAAGRLDFRRSFCGHALVGTRLAAAIFSRRARLARFVLRSAQVYGQVAALTAACALSFNLFVPRLASLVRTDMPLALALFAIGWLIWEKIRTRTAWTRRDRLLLFLLLSAGMLIKGPIVYAFLLPGLVAFQWRWRGTKCRDFSVVGMVTMAGLLSRLRCLGGRRDFFVPEFTEHVVLREFAGRFSEEMHRSQPFYFYLPHLLHRFAPWSLLLIALSFVALKKNENATKLSPETFWLVAWSLGGLLVMSFVPSKRIDRIFPIVPPLCLLLAAVIAACREKERWRPIVDRCCAVAIILSVVFTNRIHRAQNRNRQPRTTRRVCRLRSRGGEGNGRARLALRRGRRRG